MKENLLFNSKEDLQRIEKVSPKVSKKYVPIFTSKMIDILAPEFMFHGGAQFVGGLSKHYVDLVNKDGDTIRIYNSYDRTLALRVSLVSDGISIDLGVDRLIHIGAKAKEFTDDLQLAKMDIIEGIKTAKKTLAHLSKTPTTPELAKEISDVIFKGEVSIKGFQSYTNYTDVLIPKGINLRSYIQKSVNAFMTGEYTYVVNGSKKNGRVTKSVLRKVGLENDVIAFLEDKFTEYFL